MELTIWRHFLFDTNIPLDVNWELNNICNLMCPQCVRNEIKDGKLQHKIPHLNKTDTTLMTFKVAFNNIKHPVRVVRFSGNVSEPTASKDFLDICWWLRGENISIHVDTNGSTRNTEWWGDLGKIFADDKRSMVFFSLDGVGNKSLQQYRVGADFYKIIDNARAFIDTGGKAMWRMIKFKHNEHQIERAREISKEMRFYQFIEVESNRQYNMGEHWTYRGKKGFLEPTGIKKGRWKKPDKYIITCRYQERNIFYVDYLKRVWPCCYIPNKPKNGKEQDWYKKYLMERNTNSLVTSTFDTILQNEFYEQLQSSWGDDSCLTDCKKFCSQVGRVRKSYWDASELQEKYV